MTESKKLGNFAGEINPTVYLFSLGRQLRVDVVQRSFEQTAGELPIRFDFKRRAEFAIGGL
jgi:hypothetical protein